MTTNEDGAPVLRTLAQMEVEAIRDTLLHTGGSATVAARILGIGRSTLYRKIAEHGLQQLATDARNDHRARQMVKERTRPVPDATIQRTQSLKERFPPGTFGSPECNAALIGIMRAEGLLAPRR